jgi:hypothetical protein
MPLWLVLHSRSTDYGLPCYASREQLGATLGVSRAVISRRLSTLREFNLMFDVDRPADRKTRKRRPPARWGLDPFACDVWRPEVEKALARVAEEDGHDGRWYARAVAKLEAFERRSRRLANLLADDMPVVPKPRRRRKSKREKGQNAPVTPRKPYSRNGSQGSAVISEPASQFEPGGEVFTRVGKKAGKKRVEPDGDGAAEGSVGRNTLASKSGVEHTRDMANPLELQGLSGVQGPK